jgi:hypothetical protein
MVAEKIRKKYGCENCDYNTCNKTKFERHLQTQKHLGLITPEKVAEKKRIIYGCEQCDYSTINKTDFDRHINSQKHINNTGSEKTEEKKQKEYVCKCCLYETFKKADYKKHLSTQKHNDKTNKHNTMTESDSVKQFGDVAPVTNDANLTALVIELIKDNKEFRNGMLELAKNQTISNSTVTTTNNTNSNNINTNNQFNLNFFLNETCKDAMNIEDFLKTLKVNIEDFEATGKLGYVEGITRIIMNGLHQVDTTKRPIHCTDIKRETVYIKNQDAWEKENKEKEKLKNAVSQVARMNLSQLPKWQKENPESEVLDTIKHDEYMKYSMAALGGIGEKEEQKYMDKIMKNVLKEVVVSKE